MPGGNDETETGSVRIGDQDDRQRILHPDIQEGRGAHGPVARRRRGRDRLPAGDGGLSRMTGTGREGAIRKAPSRRTRRNMRLYLWYLLCGLPGSVMDTSPHSIAGLM